MARIPLSDVPETGSRIVEIDGKRVLLCRGPGGIRAMDEICPHQLLSLDGGRVRGNFIMCPHHGARFSLEDGKSLSPLTANALTFFESRVEGDELVVDL
ncbi:Rieske (2Fe-2S) protein [Sphingobium sp. AN558]|uniref:Rieske (2Fe-2S) protein n=1 Tax=Sphingobium sp. AN558 TaxID=3133442 RepID=UPI0030BFDEC8